MGKRKMLAADEKLAEQMVKIAKKKGQTLYSLVNEVLEQAVRAHNLGLSLKRIVDERSIIEAAKGAGLIFTIKPLWFDAIERAFNSGNKRSMLEKWRETGKWYGKYFIAKEPENPVKGLGDVFRNMMLGASDFVMEVNNEEGEIRCINADFPASYTQLLGEFLRAL